MSVNETGTIIDLVELVNNRVEITILVSNGHIYKRIVKRKPK